MYTNSILIATPSTTSSISLAITFDHQHVCCTSADWLSLSFNFDCCIIYNPIFFFSLLLNFCVSIFLALSLSLCPITVQCNILQSTTWPGNYTGCSVWLSRTHDCIVSVKVVKNYYFQQSSIPIWYTNEAIFGFQNY